MGFGSWISDTAGGVVSGATDAVSDVVSSATEAVSDAASNLGSTFGGGAFESVGGFFDSVKEAAGGDLGSAFDQVSDAIGGGGIFGQVSDAIGGGAGDLFGTVTDRLDELGGIGEQVGQAFGGFAETAGGSSGWAGAIEDAIGQDGGGDAGGFLGGFGNLLGGGGLSDLVPSSISEAISDGFDLPFVGDALDGISIQDIASSLPGLDGPLSSLGVAADGITDHIEDVVNSMVDPGAAWSMGSAIADGGTGFLGQIADVQGPGDIYGCVLTVSDQAGVDLPGWATDLATDPVTTLGGWGAAAGGGFMPSWISTTVAPPFDPGTIGEMPTDAPPVRGDVFPGYPGQEVLDPGDATAMDDAAASDILGGGLGDEVGHPGADAAGDPGLDEGLGDTELDAGLDEGLGDPGHDDFAEPGAPDGHLDVAPEPEPTFESEPPPPPPEPASAQIESDFDAIGDDAFGAQ